MENKRKLSSEEIKWLMKELYFNVKILVESQYDLEGIINLTKKDSNKIIFKDREKAISMVKEEMERFALKNNLDINEVKEHLFNLLDDDIKEGEEHHKPEYKEVKKIVLEADEERE